MIAEKVYKITSLIPKGKVLTYSGLAKLSGVKSPRVVGNLLHKNTDPDNIPCHRVVSIKGKLGPNYAFGGLKGQIKRLHTEGVQVNGSKVDLSKYLWISPSL